MRSHLQFSCAIALLALLAGCGGGGDGSSAVSQGGEQSLSAGPLTISAKAGAKPLVLSGGSGNVNLIAASNASFTNVLATLPRNLSSTFVLFGQNNLVWMGDSSLTNF